MDRMEAEDFSLFGLLGRSWQLEAAVADLTFDGSNGAVAFTLADGSVAIARIKDAEPAANRIRISAEDGRSSILPRSKPLTPITRFTVQENKPVALHAYGKHGFVLGDQSGQLISTTVGGERTPFSVGQENAVNALDHVEKSGLLACIVGENNVAIVDRGKSNIATLDHSSPIIAISFSPDGQQLAVAGQELLTLWDVNGEPAKMAEWPSHGRPLALSWSPGQTKLAAGFEQGGIGIWNVADGSYLSFADYPSSVRSMTWSADGETLVTSGAFRIIAWPLGNLKANGAASALETGKPSLIAIEAVASHPSQPLVAAGYENGMLIITKIGSKDELIIKTEGDGAITSLDWSKNGGYLALGSDRGLAAIVELPEQLFK